MIICLILNYYHVGYIHGCQNLFEISWFNNILERYEVKCFFTQDDINNDILNIMIYGLNVYQPKWIYYH